MAQMKVKEYALYKGEECLAIGTVKELATQFNVQEKTIRFYLSKAHKKRETKGNARQLVCLD